LAAFTTESASEHALVKKAHDKMVLLAKIINETKNKYEKENYVKKMRLMIKRWRDKKNVLTPI